MYLNTCVISCEPDCDEYFEIHEIESKESLLLRVSERPSLILNKFNL